jgi:hypothetical protein
VVVGMLLALVEYIATLLLTGLLGG